MQKFELRCRKCVLQLLVRRGSLTCKTLVGVRLFVFYKTALCFKFFEKNGGLILHTHTQSLLLSFLLLFQVIVKYLKHQEDRPKDTISDQADFDKLQVWVLNLIKTKTKSSLPFNLVKDLSWALMSYTLICFKEGFLTLNFLNHNCCWLFV